MPLNLHFEAEVLAEIPRLRRYARALTGDAYRADDLVQDTLERALNKWSLWRTGNLRAWLLTMMRNVFINQWRAMPPLDFPEDLPDVSVAGMQDEALSLRDLDRALQRLSPEHREVLLLVGLEELSYEDAAKVLGVPAGTVMSRLFRAREKMRAVLAGSDGAAASHLKVVK